MKQFYDDCFKSWFLVSSNFFCHILDIGLYVNRLWVLFRSLMIADRHHIMFRNRCCTNFVGCGSNDHLIFRAMLCYFFCLFHWCHWIPSRTVGTNWGGGYFPQARVSSAYRWEKRFSVQECKETFWTKFLLW